MLIQTILNHVEKYKSFVYGEARWKGSGKERDLEVEVKPRKNGRPRCSGFHIMKKFNEGIDEVRRLEAEQMRERGLALDGRQEPLRRRIWRGQVQTLLQWLDEQRLWLCRFLDHRLGPRWGLFGEPAAERPREIGEIKRVFDTQPLPRARGRGRGVLHLAAGASALRRSRRRADLLLWYGGAATRRRSAPARATAAASR